MADKSDSVSAEEEVAFRLLVKISSEASGEPEEKDPAYWLQLYR